MKKIILLVILLFSVLTVVACNEVPTEVPTEGTVTFQLLSPYVTLSENGVASWEAVPNAVGYSYVINNNAAINTVNTSVTLSAGDSFKVMAIGDGVTFTNSEYSNVVTYSTEEPTENPTEGPTIEPTQTPTEDGFDTISSLTTDAQYMIKGTVVAMTSKSFVVADSTGYVLVFTNTTPNVSVGDVVEVGGIPEVYGGAIQFGSTATYEAVSTKTVTHKTPTVLTNTLMTQLVSNKENVTLDYVRLTGTLTISSGKYYNIEVAGLDNIFGSVSYPINTTELTEMAGQTVIVTGYFVGITGSTSSYINICATSVVLESVDVPTETPTEEPTEDEVVDLNKITLVSVEVSYDGEEHSIYVSNLPSNYTAIYTGNGVTEEGTHTVTAKVYDADNNLVKELTATITIVEKYDVELPLV